MKLGSDLGSSYILQNWMTILSADPPSPTGGLQIFKFAFMGHFVSPVGATFQYVHAHYGRIHMMSSFLLKVPVHTQKKKKCSQLVHRRPTHYIAFAYSSHAISDFLYEKGLEKYILHSSTLLLCTCLRSL